ncbi:MAG: DUF4249 family protein [Bacteroidaceae bacterium]|nr:DUF4249 family protein [Bacteroidaceae bacterium]
MKPYSIFLAIASVLAVACTKDIEYKGPDSERMLVVNSITEAGDTPVFKMSHTAFFLDPYYSGNALKSDVTLNVSINGETRNATYVDSLYGYTDGRAIKDGDYISITASHPLYGTISAADTVPYAQNCLFSDYRKEYVPIQPMSELFEEYYLDFNDEAVDSVWVTSIEIQGVNNKKDYYMLTIEPSMTYIRFFDYMGEYDTITESLHFKVPSETKILMGQADEATAILEDSEGDSQFNWGYTDYVFEDLYIKDGNKLSFDIMMEKPDTLDYILTYDNEGFFVDSHAFSIADKINDTITYSVDVNLYVLSSTYYYYHKSVRDYINSDEISFLSEPVTILHNVIGGVGILATYTGKSFHKEFKYKFK